MNRSSALRLAALLALLLELALVTLALVIVWTARTREWYVDLGGSSATLDLSLSAMGRWLTTGMLAAIALVALVGLFALLRRPEPAPFRSTSWEAAQPTQRTPVTDDATGLQWAEPAARPAAYQSLIAGDDNTQRFEQAVPQSGKSEDATPQASEAAAPRTLEAPAESGPPPRGPEWEDSNPGQRLKVPLRMPERRG